MNTAELIERLADTFTKEDVREVLTDSLWEVYRDEPIQVLLEDVKEAEAHAKMANK